MRLNYKQKSQFQTEGGAIASPKIFTNVCILLGAATSYINHFAPPRKYQLVATLLYSRGERTVKFFSPTLVLIQKN